MKHGYTHLLWAFNPSLTHSPIPHLAHTLAFSLAPGTHSMLSGIPLTPMCTHTLQERRERAFSSGADFQIYRELSLRQVQDEQHGTVGSPKPSCSSLVPPHD